ncbi:MAG: alkaline phosphatase family protein [Candidatus Binataceae bacterium]
MRTRTRNGLAGLLIAAAIGVAGCGGGGGGGAEGCIGVPVPKAAIFKSCPRPPAGGLGKIKHIVIIMQENRSFDSYFGTFPGADGIPMVGGAPSVCVPDPVTHKCVYPYHDPNDVNSDQPHHHCAAIEDTNGGKMNGFLSSSEGYKRQVCTNSSKPCPITPLEAMGYHDDREIPLYWTYAQDFVLQDHMFESITSWSWPAHLFMVSEWSASCANGDPFECLNAIAGPAYSVPSIIPRLAWTDLTYLLHKSGVTWGYYVSNGTEPDCDDDDDSSKCVQGALNSQTPGIWNPLPLFDTVKEDGELQNVQDVSEFYTAALSGTLPAVSWIVPSWEVSEHPPYSIKVGQAYVKGLIDAVMTGPDWSSSAIFLSWDDWGGFYDHEPPPGVDGNGFGLRVPGLVISPYAKQGFIDHQVLSPDAYVKFIEDVFLNGQRLDPKTDGRGDSRPDVRENSCDLGDLANDFDFSQPARAAGSH